MSEDNRTLPYPESGQDRPTLVIPGERAAGPRRRWPWVLLVVVVVVAALAVAAELLARSILPGVVRSAVIEQLQLPQDQQLDVEADGILLPQLIAGRLDGLHLSTDEVTVQGVTGAVDVFATGVPLRGGDLTGATGVVRIDESQFATLLGATDLPIESVSFAAPDATVAGSVTVLGTAVPLSLTVTPGIADGDLELVPQRITVGGVDVEAAQVRATLGALGETITQTQRICIADQLPAGLTLTGLAIEGTEAVIGVDVAGAIVSDQSLLEKGSCADR